MSSYFTEKETKKFLNKSTAELAYETGNWDCLDYYHELDDKSYQNFITFWRQLILWMDSQNFISSKGREELIRDGIECDAVLSVDHFTPDGNKFMEEYYDKFIQLVIDEGISFSIAFDKLIKK